MKQNLLGFVKVGLILAVVFGAGWGVRESYRIYTKTEVSYQQSFRNEALRAFLADPIPTKLDAKGAPVDFLRDSQGRLVNRLQLLDSLIVKGLNGTSQ